VDEPFRRRTRANHTATHLLQSALKQVLGDDVAQQGSLVRHDGFRFDFSLPRPMATMEVQAVEALINRWIEARSAVVRWLFHKMPWFVGCHLQKAAPTIEKCGSCLLPGGPCGPSCHAECSTCAVSRRTPLAVVEPISAHELRCTCRGARPNNLGVFRTVLWWVSRRKR
jgi:hypothetical protein